MLVGVGLDDPSRGIAEEGGRRNAEEEATESVSPEGLREETEPEVVADHHVAIFRADGQHRDGREHTKVLIPKEPFSEFSLGELKVDVSRCVVSAGEARAAVAVKNRTGADCVRYGNRQAVVFVFAGQGLAEFPLRAVVGPVLGMAATATSDGKHLVHFIRVCFFPRREARLRLFSSTMHGQGVFLSKS